jgi:hypothetical protein
VALNASSWHSGSQILPTRFCFFISRTHGGVSQTESNPNRLTETTAYRRRPRELGRDAHRAVLTFLLRQRRVCLNPRFRSASAYIVRDEHVDAHGSAIQ